MDKKIITINIGSRSKKYGYFDGVKEICRAEFDVEQKESFSRFLDENNIDAEGAIVAVRIVAPGKFFADHKKIDSDYLSKLKESLKIAPVHVETVVEEIEHVLERLKDIEIQAISDSAFHKSIPEQAKIYAVPENLRDKYGLERQGYHGLSLGSVVDEIQKELGYVPEKIVACHLGGGSSVTALKDGISVDTSMGWTPLEGLPMTERVGDIDPGMVTFLSEVLNKRGKEMEDFLSKECGLEAVSGIEKGDILKLIKSEESGDKKASLALDFYAYRVRKYIGAMSAVLGGCDMLVFTGTVGLRSWQIRERIVRNLEYLGLEIDVDKNKTIYESNSIEFLGKKDGDRKIALVPIDETAQMLKILLSNTK